MAAIDFPSSPTVDQTYSINGLVWRWDGTSWVTNNTTNATNIFYGTSTPSSPVAGNMWWKSDEGRLKIYYADADSSQWVDAYPAVSAATASLSASTATSVNGILKGSGGLLTSAVAGTDYLDPAAIGSTVQGYDGDLQAIGALSATTGYLKKTASNTWELDPLSYTGVSQGTAVAATSGTSIDFTGLISSLRRITIMFDNVSTSGTSQLRIRLGTSSGIETTGYVGSSGGPNGINLCIVQSLSGGFDLYDAASAATVRTGSVTLAQVNPSTNVWSLSGVVSTAGSLAISIGGAKTLSGALTTVRVTTVNGTDTFDGGNINILYE